MHKTCTTSRHMKLKHVWHVSSWISTPCSGVIGNCGLQGEGQELPMLPWCPAPIHTEAVLSGLTVGRTESWKWEEKVAWAELDSNGRMEVDLIKMYSSEILKYLKKLLLIYNVEWVSFHTYDLYNYIGEMECVWLYSSLLHSLSLRQSFYIVSWTTV